MANTDVTTMSYDDWFDQFQPIKNMFDDNASFDGCMFETYDRELEHVKKADPANVWTLVEAEGGIYLSNGFHYVNRIGYFISQFPFTGQGFIDITVVEPDSDDEESEDD